MLNVSINSNGCWCTLPVLLLILGNDVAYLVGVSIHEDVEGAVFIPCGDLDFRDDVVDSLVSKIIKLI